MSELKPLPCPFCGGAPRSIERPDNIDGTRFFYALACYCGGYSACAHKMAVEPTPEQAKRTAIEAWNRRAQTAQAVPLLSDGPLFVFAQEVIHGAYKPEELKDAAMRAIRHHSAVRAKLGAAVPYDQTALELCGVCGWKTLIPDDGCLNCERQTKTEPQLKRIHPLDMPLEVFIEDLPTRPRRIIKDEMMYFTHSGDEYMKPPFTVRHLLMFSRSEMRKWPNLGKKSLNEIEECLRNRGLQLWEQHDERSLKFLRQHPTYWIERHGIVGKEGA